jgi:hypothetical protein
MKKFLKFIRFLMLLVMLTACAARTVSQMQYVYSSQDASFVTYVDFEINPAVEFVAVSVTADGKVYGCELTGGGTHAHCEVNVSVEELVKLRVVVK